MNRNLVIQVFSVSCCLFAIYESLPFIYNIAQFAFHGNIYLGTDDVTEHGEEEGHEEKSDEKVIQWIFHIF